MFTFYRNLSLGLKLLISGGTILVLVVSLLLFVWRGHDTFNGQAQAALEFGDAVLHIEGVLRGSHEAMSGGWGNTALEAIEQEGGKLSQFFSQATQGRYQSVLHGEEFIELQKAYQLWEKVLISLQQFVDVDEGVTLEELEETQIELLLETGKMLEEMAQIRNTLQYLSKDQYQEVAEESGAFMQMVIFGFALLSLLIFSLFYSTYRATSPPLQQLAALTRRVVETGDLSLRLEVRGNDEVGRSTTAVNHLLESMQVANQEVGDVIHAIANGNFDERVNADLKGDLGLLKQGVNQGAIRIQETMSALNGVLTSMAAGEFSSTPSATLSGGYKEALDGATTTMEAIGSAIKEINRVMSAVAAGDFKQRVDVSLKGQLQRLQSNLNGSLDTLSAAIEEISLSAHALAQGDLTQTIHTHYDGQLGTLTTALNRSFKQLHQMVEEVQENAQQIQHGNAQISSENDNLFQRTNGQAADLSDTAQSMRQMTELVQQNALRTQRADQLSNETHNKAAESNRVMAQVVEAMDGIIQSSSKIAEITNVIDSIAFQTNLLALNAAVEAARAGDHGRGFAVVAGEVRNLAQRAADATKQITGLIEQSGQRVEEGNQLVQRSGESLQEMIGAVEQVGTIISEITTIGQQQSEGIGQVNYALEKLDSTTQQNAALVEQGAANAQNMEEQSSSLITMMNKFTLEIT